MELMVSYALHSTTPLKLRLPSRKYQRLLKIWLMLRESLEKLNYWSSSIMKISLAWLMSRSLQIQLASTIFTSSLIWWRLICTESFIQGKTSKMIIVNISCTNFLGAAFTFIPQISSIEIWNQVTCFSIRIVTWKFAILDLLEVTKRQPQHWLSMSSPDGTVLQKLS